jgi:hypothetical protein
LQPTQLPLPKSPKPLQRNPYGIAALWSGSDGVAKGVLLILAIMSMGSWYILAVKMLEQRKAGAYAREAAEKFWVLARLHKVLLPWTKTAPTSSSPQPAWTLPRSTVA